MTDIRKYACFGFIPLVVLGCSSPVEDDYADEDLFTDSGLVVSTANINDSTTLRAANTAEIINYSFGETIETKNTSPKALADYAQTLIGIPYKFASSDPRSGFDCSGFITYVFNHFDIAVPRSSRDFTNIGENIPRTEARAGDLILFTGTNIQDRTVGHMGIVTFNSPDTLLFIHSTSGKLNSVTVTPLNEYYQSRFVKVIRVFKENNRPSANQ
ncbi:MAG TPA: C40 family peptidase [Flavitalea sp.]|nr:C40 family peptidase [Flavitalea sp.]